MNSTTFKTEWSPWKKRMNIVSRHFYTTHLLNRKLHIALSGTDPHVSKQNVWQNDRTLWLQNGLDCVCVPDIWYRIKHSFPDCLPSACPTNSTTTNLLHSVYVNILHNDGSARMVGGPLLLPVQLCGTRYRIVSMIQDSDLTNYLSKIICRLPNTLSAVEMLHDSRQFVHDWHLGPCMQHEIYSKEFQ